MQVKIYRHDKDQLAQLEPLYTESIQASVDLSENGVTISVTLTGPFKREENVLRKFVGQTLSKEFIFEEYKGKVIDFFVSDTPEFSLITKNLFMFSNRFSGSLDTVKAGKRIARISFDDIDDCVYIFFAGGHEPFPGFENIVFDETNNLADSQVAYSASSLYKQVYDRFVRKNSLLNKVDYYDTLSYLEAQVDVLTTVVLALIGNSTVDENLVSVLSKASEYSVISNKPVDALIEEVTVKKEKFRLLQEEYYKKVYGSNDSEETEEISQ